jgi:hypothetical protein
MFDDPTTIGDYSVGSGFIPGASPFTFSYDDAPFQVGPGTLPGQIQLAQLNNPFDSAWDPLDDMWDFNPRPWDDIPSTFSIIGPGEVASLYTVHTFADQTNLFRVDVYNPNDVPINLSGELAIVGYDGLDPFGDSSNFNYSDDIGVIFGGDVTVQPNTTVSTIAYGAGEIVGRFGFNSEFHNTGDLPVGVNVGAIPGPEY